MGLWLNPPTLWLVGVGWGLVGLGGGCGLGVLLGVWLGSVVVGWGMRGQVGCFPFKPIILVVAPSNLCGAL